MENKYLTSKCNHNQRGRCINCLSKQLKEEKMANQRKNLEKPKAEFADEAPKPTINKCNHPAHAKCINCLPMSTLMKDQCEHPPTIKCAKCISKEYYTTFKEYLKRLEEQCTHKKPCQRCVPAQALYYFVNKNCRNHLPYPQAMCNLCLPPTVTVKKQQYTHVKQIEFKTFDLYRFIEMGNRIAFLYGRQQTVNDETKVQVQALYFPKQQFNRETEDFQLYEDEFQDKLEMITESIGLRRVGLIYDSSDLSHQQLLRAAHYQDIHRTNQYGHNISTFVSVRVIRNHQTGQSEGIQAFMVSDQFHTFDKNNLVYTMPNANEFGLQVAVDKRDNLPTYLREGIETDRIKFVQCIVWVQCVESITMDCYSTYPFFNVESMSLDRMQQYIEEHETLDNLDRLHYNFQFLLHMADKIGIEIAINLCLCQSIEDAKQIENRIRNWIREEKSDALIRKEKQVQQPNRLSMAQSRIKQDQWRQQQFLRQQEEKWLRQLQERQWMEETKWSPEMISEQEQLMRIHEMKEQKKREEQRKLMQQTMMKKKKPIFEEDLLRNQGVRRQESQGTRQNTGTTLSSKPSQTRIEVPSQIPRQTPPYPIQYPQIPPQNQTPNVVPPPPHPKTNPKK